MKVITIRGRAGTLVLISGMVMTAFTAKLSAQTRWGEVGAAGIYLKEPSRYGGDSAGGLVLNAGLWRKAVSFEAYIVSLGIYFPIPIGLGGNVIVTPFHSAHLIPYISAGFMLGIGSAISPNAGIGLKLPLNRGWGLRTDVRVLRYDKETYAEIGLGVYLAFGRRGARPPADS